MSAPDERSCYACDLTSEGVCAPHRLADAAPALLAALEKIHTGHGFAQERRADCVACAAIQAAKGATP